MRQTARGTDQFLGTLQGLIGGTVLDQDNLVVGIVPPEDFTHLGHDLPDDLFGVANWNNHAHKCIECPYLCFHR